VFFETLSMAAISASPTAWVDALPPALMLGAVCLSGKCVVVG
jgi:hypothetical protein